MSIPRIFHHVWTSGDEMPDRVLAMRQTWIDRHPEWEFRIWRLEDLAWLAEPPLFERAETYAQKADIARYEIVQRFGGVYLDTDMECLRPLDGLVDRCEFFAARQYDGYVAIGIFGATPFHPILRQTIERLPASSFFHRGEPIYVQTGPILFDKVLKDGRWEGRPVSASSPRVLLSVRPVRALASPRDVRSRLRRASLGSQLEGRERVSGRVPDSYRSEASALLRSSRPRGGRGAHVPSMWARSRVALRRETSIDTREASRARAVRRLLPPLPAMLHGIPWGPGESSSRRLPALGSCVRPRICPSSPGLALTGTYDSPFVEFLRQRLVRA